MPVVNITTSLTCDTTVMMQPAYIKDDNTETMYTQPLIKQSYVLNSTAAKNES